MPPSDQRFEKLCSLALDDSLNARQLEELAELIREEPARAKLLRQDLIVADLLNRQSAARSDEHFVGMVTDHVIQTGSESEREFPQRVQDKILSYKFRRQVVTSVSILATAALVTLAVVKFGPNVKDQPLSDPQPSVAISEFTPESGTPEATTVIVSGQKIEFSEGIIKLEFGNGAVVAVEGPTAFTVDSAMQITLDTGNLNAWCPEAAHGFKVLTRSATLTDLGTSFGVSAFPDGSADFLVLDGEVEVSKGDESRVLPRGKAIRADLLDGLLEDLSFEPSLFARTWPVTSGIVSTTGNVISAPPNTPEALATHEDDNHVLVIPERRGLELPEQFPADILDPGNYGGPSMNRLNFNKNLTTESGTEINSYSLRYNPVGILDFMVFKRFEGSVTFDRPVLAIVTSSGKLWRTDEMVSTAPLPQTEEDPDMRGVEAGPKTDPDTVILSEDRHTVTVIFNAGESVDEIRVITAAN